jgi:hypothetical protein
VALERRAAESRFLEELASFDRLLEEIGEMPADGWQRVWVQGPIETPAGPVVYADVPVWDKDGEDMGWFIELALLPGAGEEWVIDHASASN